MRTRLVVGLVAVVVASLVKVFAIHESRDGGSSSGRSSAAAERPTRVSDRVILRHHERPVRRARASTGPPGEDALPVRYLAGALRPCSRARTFAVYALGRAFAPDGPAEVGAECQDPPPVSGGRLVGASRKNDTVLQYGPCVSAPGDSGCAYDIQVQNRPACEQPHWLYHWFAEGPTDVAPHRHFTIDGIPAASFEGGIRIEVYTRQTTVQVAGPTPARTLAAARSLQDVQRRVAGQPSAPHDPATAGSQRHIEACVAEPRHAGAANTGHQP